MGGELLRLCGACGGGGVERLLAGEKWQHSSLEKFNCNEFRGCAAVRFTHIWGHVFIRRKSKSIMKKNVTS